MTAFDTAWNLVKMPVVPESIVEDKNRIDARYLDRKTGEEMPIYAVHNKDFATIRGGIGSDMSPLASMRAWSHGGDAYSVSEAYTKPHLRRRGYAKELYDFIAHYLEGGGGHLIGGEPQAHHASEMWRKHAPEGIWPSNRIGEKKDKQP
tara:strand:+ start:5260 stop:5706 length:447 start_codon:yes stop_codon:yes gene_type:complete